MLSVNVIVLPGISIGDEVVVGSGVVVIKSIESNSFVIGNLAPSECGLYNRGRKMDFSITSLDAKINTLRSIYE